MTDAPVTQPCAKLKRAGFEASPVGSAVTDRLREITHLRGDADPGRRWFASPDLDLIVWSGPDGRVRGFQLCYDKLREEKALTWREGRGFIHNRVDTGETVDGGHKGTPVLDGAVHCDAARVRELFVAAAIPLPMTLRTFVERKLGEALGV